MIEIKLTKNKMKYLKAVIKKPKTIEIKTVEIELKKLLSEIQAMQIKRQVYAPMVSAMIRKIIIDIKLIKCK